MSARRLRSRISFSILLLVGALLLLLATWHPLNASRATLQPGTLPTAAPDGNTQYLPIIQHHDGSAPTTTPTPTPTFAPTLTPIVTATLTATVTPTSTATPTATAAPTPSFVLQGGPIDVVSVRNSGISPLTKWFLPPDGKIVASVGDTYPSTQSIGAADPFPLDPTLGINDIDVDGNGNLVAATDEGLYRRSAASGRWQKFSSTVALHLAAYPYLDSWLYIIPQEAPQEVWFSQNNGQSWESKSSGLAGDLVGPLVKDVNFGFNLLTVTVRNGQYVIWETPVGEEAENLPNWQELAVVPGPVVDHERIGVAPGLIEIHPFSFRHLLIGGGDGNLYAWHRDGEQEGSFRWSVVQRFGEQTYPLVLGGNGLFPEELSVLDLETGRIDAYQLEAAPAEVEDFPLVQGTWQPLPFPSADAPWSALVAADVGPVQRIYPGPEGGTHMALGQEGALYAFGLVDDGEGNLAYQYRLVTEQPQRTEFVVGNVDYAEIGPLYSGATLTWRGADCTADEPNFYRSDNQGLTWTVVASDTARVPVASIAFDANQIIANSCSGPTVSADGGQTWQTPSNLGWPLSVGAEHLAFNGQSELGEFLYAAGVEANGSPFIYRGTYSSTAQTVDEWVDITPGAMTAPQVLSVNTGNFVRVLSYDPYQPGVDLYLVDENTVWLTKDNGTTWQSRAEGLNGAAVRSLRAYQNAREMGLLAATDQGLFIGPDVGASGPWLPTQQRYTSSPVKFVGVLNGADYAYALPDDLFYYLAPGEEAFVPTADAYVDESEPDANLGNSAQRNLLFVSFEATTYMRFDVRNLAGELVEGKLRLFVEFGGENTLNVHLAAESGWQEREITYNNAPPFGDPVGRATGTFERGEWVEVEIGPLVLTEEAVTLVLTALDESGGVTFDGRERTEYAPHLILKSATD